MSDVGSACVVWVNLAEFITVDHISVQRYIRLIVWRMIEVTRDKLGTVSGLSQSSLSHLGGFR